MDCLDALRTAQTSIKNLEWELKNLVDKSRRFADLPTEQNSLAFLNALDHARKLLDPPDFVDRMITMTDAVLAEKLHTNEG